MESPEKKPFLRRWYAWPLTAISLLLFWPMGIFLLFAKLDDLRKKREDARAPDSFLSYSPRNTEKENRLAAQAEHGMERVILLAKVMAPLLLLAGVCSVIMGIGRLGCGDTAGYLLRGMACLTMAGLFAFYGYKKSRERKALAAQSKEGGARHE